MKKFLKVLLIVISILLVITACIVIWQWSNIKSVYMSVKYSAEEIDSLTEENEEKINEILNELTESEMYPLTEEEREMLANGDLSEEEAIRIIKSGRQPNEESDQSEYHNSDDSAGTQSATSDDWNYEDEDGDSVSTKPNTPGKGKGNNTAGKVKNGQDSKKESGQKSTGKTDDIIARIYLLRAEYVNALYGLEAEAAAYVKSISYKDWTVSKKMEVVDIYTGKAVALEGQCDARMNTLLGELEAELKKNGGNVSIISEIKSVYTSEKELKKSQFLNKYGKYL